MTDRLNVTTVMVGFDAYTTRDVSLVGVAPLVSLPVPYPPISISSMPETSVRLALSVADPDGRGNEVLNQVSEPNIDLHNMRLHRV